jgi:mono/diheme cytochrome c family protein
MMAASSLCTDNEREAAEIDEVMPDIAAFIRSIEPPAFPDAIDAELAARGETAFAATCSRCHGTYGSAGQYPNLVISVDEVGTDSTLALGAAFFAGRFVDWYNESFFGELGFIAPAPGYYAPSLRGIWSTGPFFHNGSVPDLFSVLDSTARPRFWTRNFDRWDYDLARVGWRYTELSSGKSGAADDSAAALIYDTTELGYGNGGHEFGDALSDPDRAAIVEYLKTL